MRYFLIFALISSFLNADAFKENKKLNKKEYENNKLVKDIENYKKVPKAKSIKSKKRNIEITGSFTLEHEFD